VIARRWVAVGTLGLGLAVATAAQWLIPGGGPPLYDGVVVQEPYRYLSPQPDQEGDPTSYRETLPVEGGKSPAIAAATQEVPPQAQLIAAPSALELPAGATALTVAIEPVTPAVPADIQGNVYRVQITDQAGALIATAAGAVPKIVLRAPSDLQQARIVRLSGATWQELPTQHGGQPGIYVANPTAFGDFAVLGAPVSLPQDGGIDPRVLGIGAAIVLGSAALLTLVFLRSRRDVAPVEVVPRRSRVAPKRRRRKRR
jgi:hypothetical protein